MMITSTTSISAAPAWIKCVVVSINREVYACVFLINVCPNLSFVEIKNKLVDNPYSLSISTKVFTTASFAFVGGALFVKQQYFK